MKQRIIQFISGLFLAVFCLFMGALTASTIYAAPNETPGEETEIVRVRPVLEGEDLESISQSVYDTGRYADDIYELNKDIIGDNPENLQVGMILVLPEPENDSGYLDWEYCYDQVGYDAYVFDEIYTYIDEDAGCTVTDYFFYYDGEGKGEKFKICYPQLTFDDGRDATAINKAIEQEAMFSAERMMIHIDPDLKEMCESEEYDRSYEGIESQVNYKITYLDENLISVIFNDHYFMGTVFGEYVALRSVTINLNTGHVYTNEELWEDFDGIAAYYRDEIIQYSKRDGSENVIRMCEDFLTEDVMSQIMQTQGFYEGRYEIKTFVTRYGVGISLTYWASGETYLTRGWIELEFPRKEVVAYQADSELWNLWEYKTRTETKYFNSLKR